MRLSLIGFEKAKGLCGVDKTTHFILMAKRDHIAARLGVRKGDFVVTGA